MSDEIGSIHRLHVVNFESKISELSEETLKLDDTDNAKNTQEKSKPQRFNAVGENPACMKILSISDTALRSSRVNNAHKIFLEKTSFSPFKKPLHTRSVSINDLKRKPSSKNLEFSERIKRTFKSAASQTSKKHIRTINQKVKPCKDLSNNNHKLQVLFTSKTKNLTKKIRNRSFCRECRRLDLFYDSKSSGDNLGFNSNNNNYCKSLSCYLLLTSQRHFPPSQFTYRNYRQDDDCFKKSPKEDLVKSYTAGSYAYTIPIHYNLEFPYDFEHCDTEPRTFQLCGDETDRKEPCSCVHEQVSVTSSCFSTCRNDGDCLFNAQCIINPSIEIKSDEINIKRNQGRILKHGDCAGFIKPISLRTINLAEQPLWLAKSTLKYILFVLAVIAWSPCIITLCLYLLIMYPLRPQNIFKDYNETEDVCCQCGSCFKCRYNFFLSIFLYFVRVCRKVRYAYNALYSFLKEKTYKNPCPCLSRIYSYRQPRCKQGSQNYPNPKNKYVLYHSSRRGWLMKPVRAYSVKNSHPCCHQKKQNLKAKGTGKVRPCAINYKLYESKGQKLSSNPRICCSCQSVRQNVKGTVKDLGSRSWKCDICDHIMCAHTIRK